MVTAADTDPGIISSYREHGSDERLRSKTIVRAEGFVLTSSAPTATYPSARSVFGRPTVPCARLVQDSPTLHQLQPKQEDPQTLDNVGKSGFAGLVAGIRSPLLCVLPASPFPLTAESGDEKLIRLGEPPELGSPGKRWLCSDLLVETVDARALSQAHKIKRIRGTTISRWLRITDEGNELLRGVT
jgi:hypothetical protein